MVRLLSKTLFFTTSPRNPQKMKPEIYLLHEHFEGQYWDKTSQEKFIDLLAESNFFVGKGSPTDKAFSARDRINRAPKSLGFVDLSPCIKLTEAGQQFILSKRPQEVFLRQLLKFQLPSPFHRENNGGSFHVRPYLEIMRLIRELEYLTFDELKVFALQLTDYHQFNSIKAAILAFRAKKKMRKGEYKKIVSETWTKAIKKIYWDEIKNGKTKTRETDDASLSKFIKIKKNNLRDYADACFRYLRYTGLISITHRSKKISFFPEKLPEVDHLLTTVERDPVFVDDLSHYKAHLFSSTQPVLYVDARENIIDTLMRIGKFTKREFIGKTIEELKDVRDEIIQRQKDAAIQAEVDKIKSYSLYSDIVDAFKGIISDEYYDAPLMFEYNTWRAMTMLDGGDIRGNFNVDDVGQPLSTAQGNMADIECDYGNFVLSVEVTLQRGQRQYETEGEPVARHYGQLKERSGKEAYCLFIAPKINPAALTHFYMLNQIPSDYYGGKAHIVPLELDQFVRLLGNSHNSLKRPTPVEVQGFFDLALDRIAQHGSENKWSAHIQNCVNNWLV